MRTRVLAGVACVLMALTGVGSTDAQARRTKKPNRQFVFTSAPTPAPAVACCPSPADGATGQSTSATLSWTAASGATSYDVRFGTSDPPALVSAAQVGTTYNPGALSSGTTYYWQVTARNSSGFNTGPVWRFATAGGGGSVLTSSDVTYLGTLRLDIHGNCYTDASYGSMTMRYVGGARHLLMSQDNGRRWAPCEFVDTATYDSSGNCTANCPSTTLATSPVLASVANWGFDKNGVAGNVTYDFFHGIVGKCWGDATDCNNNGSTAYNDCTFYGGSGCLLTQYFLVPGTPDKLFFSYGQSYGAGYHDWSLGFCTLDTLPVSGVTDPVTTCYGPFRPKGTGTLTHNVDGNASYYLGGLKTGNMMLNLPGGTYGFTGSEGGAAYAGAFGSAGPYLFKIDALPTTSTDQTSASPFITASTKYLWYHTMACHDATQANCGDRQANYDGSMPVGRDIWAYRHQTAYAYMPDATPCAINFDNPVGQPPGCGGAITKIVGDMFVDPRTNSGTTTWQNLDSNTGAVWFQGSTKQGVLFFVSLATNHRQTVADITNCTFTPSGGSLQNVAHTSYCNGQYKGASGFTCSGAPDGGYGHPGDVLSPEFQCPYVDIATGPSDTFREPAILIYSVSDLNAIAAGTTADYTVNPSSVMFPLTDMNSSMAFAPTGTNGVAMSWGQGGVAHDPNNSHIVYVAAPQADRTTRPGEFHPVIHVFKIAG